MKIWVVWIIGLALVALVATLVAVALALAPAHPVCIRSDGTRADAAYCEGPYVQWVQP
jgi:hypothetical protein